MKSNPVNLSMFDQFSIINTQLKIKNLDWNEAMELEARSRQGKLVFKEE